MRWLTVLALSLAVAVEDKGLITTQPAALDNVTIQIRPSSPTSAPAAPRFTARLTADSLKVLLEEDDLPTDLRAESQRAAAAEALGRINMAALLDELAPHLSQRFGQRFDIARNLLTMPVEEARQTTVDAEDLFPEPYRGPKQEIIGVLLHDVTNEDFRSVGFRAIQTARQLVEAGDPVHARGTPEYYRWLARREVQDIRTGRSKGELAKLETQEIRRRIGKALGVKNGEDGSAAPNWLKESRRFSYIIKQGQFIDRLTPLVEQINREMEIAGYRPPSPLDSPGIYYDPEIGDVDLVLPKDMLVDFLARADEFERRMAEDSIISIEAVRLTDREIVEGAIASRLSAQIQGVHDVDRFKRKTVVRELGLNSLLAVANQQLTAQTLSGIGAGTLPAGTPPITIAPPTLPPIDLGGDFTTLGSTFSVGADDVFFDGRQQVYGFSYIGVDGIAHTLTTEVVDSLRELWERIERNLIVHKIKKTGSLTEFSVPVGPNTRTYKGIAALISQENQQLIVATGTGAISEIRATAGTWLVIEDFQIGPVPGSSTTLTREEKENLRSRVLLTMFLRDPFVALERKRALLDAKYSPSLSEELERMLEENRDRPLRNGEQGRTHGAVFEQRLRDTLGDREYEKREENSNITLTFFSSQGNIIQSPGQTQLGDANDLTSFTTVVRPNVVTPISSFVTKSGSTLTGSSPLTGVAKGERSQNDKSMTHLVIRARFPNSERERLDREEGGHLGYFKLPFEREPSSEAEVPLLSSSEHPAQRLANLRVGLMFEVLDASRVRRPLSQANPNRFPGDVPPAAWETATTRLLMLQRIISDAGGAIAGIATDYVARFIAEVRSLLEYDPDFFAAPNMALRNTLHWNDPDRIIVALNNSPGRFALTRLVEMLDELGATLVPDDYAASFLAVSPPSGLHRRRIYPLSDAQLRALRRDAAAHYLRIQAAYGDAFLEAVSTILKLGTYRAKGKERLCEGILRGYRDLVVFDNSSNRLADPERHRLAHEDFLYLKRGGYDGGLFGRSKLALEHLPDVHRQWIHRGPDILKTMRYAENRD